MRSSITILNQVQPMGRCVPDLVTIGQTAEVFLSRKFFFFFPFFGAVPLVLIISRKHAPVMPLMHD